MQLRFTKLVLLVYIEKLIKMFCDANYALGQDNYAFIVPIVIYYY